MDVAAPEPRAITIGPFGSSLRADLYTDSGVPVVRGQDITAGRHLNETNLVFVPQSVADSFPACIVKQGDLIFPHRGAIGRVGIVGERQYLLSSSMMKLTCDQTLVVPEYVFYYFRGPGRRELMARASTVGTPGIGQPLRSLRGIPIEFPPLDQQRGIAEVLGALDDKIAANTKLNDTIDEYIGTLFAAEVALCEDVTPLRELARINAESVNPVTGGSLRYIDIASVGIGRFDYPAASDWAEAPGRARRRVRKGDVLWSTVRPNRRSHALNLSDDPSLVGSTGLAVLTPVTVGFAYLYEVTRLPAFTAFLESAAEGSAYPAVRADRFGDAIVPWLSRPDRETFESIAAPMREHAHSLESENRHLAAMREALLPQLMSGRIRVKDVKQMVGDVV